MNIEQLMKVRSEGPYNHQDYTIYLHNIMIESMRVGINRLREVADRRGDVKEAAHYQNVLALPELQIIKYM